MKTKSMDRIHRWVLDYVNGFRQASGALPPPLVLKLEHSQRVAEQARDIARDLLWSPKDVDRAEALGWLHDVGRFAQFAEFGHFHDATSVDHGFRGFEVVQTSGILAGLPEPCRCCLLEGIRHHNAKTIPATIVPACLPFLKLIRDADKLDIYRVVTEGLRRNGFRELADMWPHIDLAGPVNPRLLREIQTQRAIDIVHVRSLADFLLLQAFWVYDLHYAPTRERIRRNRVLETLGAYLPDDPAARGALEKIRNDLMTGKDPKLETAPC